MREKLIAVTKNKVTSIISFFKRTKQEKLLAQNPSKNYYSLSPVDDAEQAVPYFDALSWGIENRGEKNIRNIALTGPYGSGKSSILRTFQKNNKDKKLHFLNISLATFKEEGISKDESLSSKSDDLLRLIELSILQQIFYHEEDSKIPDSRFKKIKSQNKWNLRLISLSLFIMSVIGIIVFKPEVLKERLFDFTLTPPIQNDIRSVCLIVFSIGIFFIILKSTRIINSLKIDKLNIQSAEIKVDESVNKSILNHHLDEILYFFEVTQYNVVIIEDLDRFKQTEIFTKLRELNLLINNSKKTKKDVVFIYAVRDDLFIDKDRTKFFDFIIPIIPVINSSNSNEKFVQKIKENRYGISEDLIEDISLFVDDMRLLNNIINEYNIYALKLNVKLDQNRLFAMIVYKNIYPNDFINLSNGEGKLFNVFAKKQEHVKDLLKQIDEKITKNEKEIQELEKLEIKNIKELRALYILKFIEENSGFVEFVINAQNRSVNQVMDDSYFEIFKNQAIEYNKVIGSGYSIRTVSSKVNFKQIEDKVDSNSSYEKREKQIIDLKNGKTEILKKDIENLESEKLDIRLFKLQEILTRTTLNIEIDNERQRQFLNILLRNGYINEDYHDYISIFYEGSISKDDHNFLLNVKSQVQSDFNHPLLKVNNLIRKINEKEFNKNYILNYSLLDYLLTNNSYKNRRDSIFKILTNESNVSINFISSYIENGKNIGLFVNRLCKNWSNVWRFIENQSNFTQQRKRQYLSLIMEHVDINDIKNISLKSDLVKTISTDENFLRIINSTGKLKEVIKNLNIKFQNLVVDEEIEDLFDFVYKGCYYEINEKTISLTIKNKGSFNQIDFDTRNYYALNESNCQELIAYINDNLNSYLENVYLKLENNTNEMEEYLIELLDNKSITTENKTKIIEKIEVIITSLSTIKEKELKDTLLNRNKVKPDWDNMIDYFISCDNSFNENAVNFLNNSTNSESLSNSKIPKNSPDKDTCNKFMEAVMLTEGISNENYRLLLNSIPYYYDSDFGYINLSSEKVILLIDTDTIKLNESNFNSLKEHFEKLHIRLIENDYSEFEKDIINYQLEEEDIIDLLKSEKLPMSLKSKIISSINNELIRDRVRVLNLLGPYILDDFSFTEDAQIIKNVIVKSDLWELGKISIFNNKESLFDDNDITEILNSLEYPYSDIAINGKRPILQENRENMVFVNILSRRRIISKFEHEKKGIRISTFRK